MLKKLIALTLLMVLIIGCTPQETDQTADLPPAENTSESAVNPVESDTTEEDVDSDVTTIAPSDSVDLEELTPDAAGEGGELIVQPAPGVPDPELKMAQLAGEDLAEQLDIDIGEITLVEVVSMDWPDAGLGCPDPDLLYAAVITPGYQITLEVNGESYVYHTDTVENIVLCIDGQPAQ